MTIDELRVRYQTLEFGDVDIHVRTLRNVQEFSDVDGVAARLGIGSATWPLFGVVWTSSEILAGLMVDYEIEGRRILELGCGIGLATLVLNHREADITATDHHPMAGPFLRHNVALNEGRAVPFVRTGWADEGTDLGAFDLIVASDVLYEADHVQLVAEFIDRHAKPKCAVVIVDPGRRQHARFSKAMVARGYRHTQRRAGPESSSREPFHGWILEYARG